MNDPAQVAPAVLAGCSGLALVALLLSLTRLQSWARVTAQTALLLTLLAVPLALVLDVVFTRASGDPGSKAMVLARTISHAMNYGALALPGAGIAGLALRRVNARR
jgi:hypothetical protein